MQRLPSFLKRHPRLISAVVFGLIAGALAFNVPAVTRMLIGWNCGVWLYLLLFAAVIRSNPHAVKHHAAVEDESAEVVLFLITLAAVVSLAAIVFDLVGVRGFSSHSRGFHYALAGVTVLGSWLLIGVVFSIHYAHLFYMVGEGPKALRFPDKIKEPDYWDFLYFALTINVALQTSDVIIASPAMRRVVLAQSVICFLFNTAILGFCINVAAGLTAG